MPYIDKVGIAGSQYDIKDTTGTFIAPKEISPATADHAAGTYLVYDGALYRVGPSAIAEGDTLTVGTNITAVPGGIGGEVSELQSQIDEKAPAIIMTDDAAYNHTVDGVPTKITLIGMPNTVGTVKISDKLNILPESNKSKSDANATFSVNDYRGYINGTISSATSSLTVFSGYALNIPAGDYKFLLYYDITGATVSAYNKLHTELYVWYGDGSSSTRVINSFVTTIGAGMIETKITLSDDVTKISLVFSLASGSVYSNARFSYGLYPENAVITDTGLILSEGQTAEFDSVSAYTSGILCSMQNKSIVEYIADTKNYVDDHIPDDMLTKGDLVYITPEMYGAVGDGVTDDSTALNNCIAVGISDNIPVRGYGAYKTSTPIVVNSVNGTDVFIHVLKSATGVSALKIGGQFGRIAFDYIYNCDVGIEVQNGAFANKIDGVIIIAKYSGIKFVPIDATIAYNTFRINRINVTDGNCIEGPTLTHDHTQTNPDVIQQENYFYDCTLRCPNGWAVYNSPGRYYNIDMESSVKNGIHMDGGMHTFTGCRYAELVNKAEDGDTSDGGLLIKHLRGGLEFNGASRKIPYNAIDVSEAPDFDDCSTTVKNSLMWMGVSINAPIYAVGRPNTMLGNRMLLFAKMKICSPMYNVCQTIDSDYDMRINGAAYPTRMIIDAADCTIHLSSSYCSLGYNTFVIDQSATGKYCTIYDSRDDVTPIFDGQTLGAGTYRLTAECTLESGIGAGHSYDGFTGNNDVWIVEKIS